MEMFVATNRKTSTIFRKSTQLEVSKESFQHVGAEVWKDINAIDKIAGFLA